MTSAEFADLAQAATFIVAIVILLLQLGRRSAGWERPNGTGPMGPAGPAGLQGPIGLPGLAGVPGQNGISGANGHLVTSALEEYERRLARVEEGLSAQREIGTAKRLSVIESTMVTERFCRERHRTLEDVARNARRGNHDDAD